MKLIIYCVTCCRSFWHTPHAVYPSRFKSGSRFFNIQRDTINWNIRREERHHTVLYGLCLALFEFIFTLVSVATRLLRCLITNWVTDGTASARTPWTNRPTAASRESQVHHVRHGKLDIITWRLTVPHSLCRWPPLSAALDGVPFSLHPKFDVQANSTVRLHQQHQTAFFLKLDALSANVTAKFYYKSSRIFIYLLYIFPK